MDFPPAFSDNPFAAVGREVEEVRSPPEATGAETQAAEKKTEAKAEKQKVSGDGLHLPSQ